MCENLIFIYYFNIPVVNAKRDSSATAKESATKHATKLAFTVVAQTIQITNAFAIWVGLEVIVPRTAIAIIIQIVRKVLAFVTSVKTTRKVNFVKNVKSEAMETRH